MSEAKKYDELKLRYDLLPLDAEARIAEIYTRGAAKYGDRNWEKGMSWGRLYAAARRHLDRFWAGEDLDPEWDTPHLAHAAVCIQMLLAYQLRGSGQDDRARLPTELETVLKDVGADGRSHES